MLEGFEAKVAKAVSAAVQQEAERWWRLGGRAGESLTPLNGSEEIIPLAEARKLFFSYDKATFIGK